MLAVVFEDFEGFKKEYYENLTKGGLFVPTQNPLELRTRIAVGIDLAFCREAIVLEGEVVHCVPPELATAGAVPGVAVQFDQTAAELTEIFENLIGPLSDSAEEQESEPDSSATGRNRRGAAREVVRVGARVCNSRGEQLQGMTRNLSSSGLLFSVEGDSLPIGEQVVVTLTNSKTGESLDIPSEVKRQVKDEAGDVPALGIQFSPDKQSQEKTKAFLRRLRDMDHTRRLGGISGEIEELGMAGLLQSFGVSTHEGTLTVINGSQEGYIAFSQGALVATRSGKVTGKKALVRLLRWTTGQFEFHSLIDNQIVREPPEHLEGAILDALREIDESRRNLDVCFPADISFELARDAITNIGADLGKIECAILDLVRVGANVRKLLDVIPEADVRIHRAISWLIENEILFPRTPES